MSRSRYRPKYRHDQGWWDWHARWKRRREDIRTGLVRTRVYRSRKAVRGHSLAHLLVTLSAAKKRTITETPVVPGPGPSWLDGSNPYQGRFYTDFETVKAWSDALKDTVGVCPFEKRRKR